METVLSGIRPTGNLHLGNYFGALQNFVKMQHENNCFFFIADYHSLTTHPKPADLQKTAKETTPQYTHWVISVGGAGAGLNAAMPAFKDVISEEDIWRIVTYLETTYGK